MKYVIRAALMALSIATIPPVMGATLHDAAHTSLAQATAPLAR